MKAQILLQVLLLCIFLVFFLKRLEGPCIPLRTEGPCIPLRTGMSEAMER